MFSPLFMLSFFIWKQLQNYLISIICKMTGLFGGAAATTSASIFTPSKQIVSSAAYASNSSNGNPISSSYVCRYHPVKRKFLKKSGRVSAVAPVATTPVKEVKEYVLLSWAEFDLGLAPVYWKTINGLPPTSGEKLKLFYNPAASKLVPSEEFGIAFNGGFNQPIMCGGEPRVMLQKVRALSLIFSFTNGKDWDGPYRLQFRVSKAWRNKPIEFFTEGLAEELSKEGACERAIFPDTNMVIARCAVIGNLSVEGGDRCNLDLVPGCTDPSSPFFNPLANVDDGSCPPYSDSED